MGEGTLDCEEVGVDVAEPEDVYDEEAGKADDEGGMEGAKGEAEVERGRGYGFIEGESSGDGKKGVLFCTGAGVGATGLMLAALFAFEVLGCWSKKNRSLLLLTLAGARGC